MASVVRQIFVILFAIFALMGFAYFGPPQYTMALTSNRFFRQYLGPALDHLLLSEQEASVTVGYLSESKGDLSFRPSTELVFLPAHEGQRFYGGTLVSSGEKSSALITLADSSELRLAANSTVYLEFPQEGQDMGVIRLKVIKGTVEAEQKDEGSHVKVKLVTPRGRVARVERHKLVVVAPTERIDPRKKNAQQFSSDVLRPQDEYVGVSTEAPQIKEIEKALREGRKPAIAERKDIFEKIDSELETELNRMPRPQVVKQEKPVEEKPVAIQQPSLVAPTAVEPQREPAQAAPVEVVIAKPVVAPIIPPRPKVVLAPKPKPVVEQRPQSIGERKSKTQVKIKNFEAPPEGSDLSGAIFASKQGDHDTAQRLVASALTKSEYNTDSFNDATRFSVDELMKSYVDSGDCAQAKNTLLNVARAYSTSSVARSWAKNWRDLYKQKCQ